MDKGRTYTGASPDGFIYYESHGTLVIKIKCPPRIRDEIFLKFATLLVVVTSLTVI